jgi:hypothetical protein
MKTERIEGWFFKGKELVCPTLPVRRSLEPRKLAREVCWDACDPGGASLPALPFARPVLELAGQFAPVVDPDMVQEKRARSGIDGSRGQCGSLPCAFGTTHRDRPEAGDYLWHKKSLWPAAVPSNLSWQPHSRSKGNIGFFRRR